MTAQAWLQAARSVLTPILGADGASREARLILRHATGWSAARVAVAGDDMLTDTAKAGADTMLARRIAREPMAQILGAWTFFGRSFDVTADVLTPRADTETLVERALSAPFQRLLDLGTGSGAIAITLLAERPGATGVATDISARALAVARRNCDRLGVADRLRLLVSDWWTGVDGVFDLIVSNPPYVSAADYATLAPEITRFEPPVALSPGGDGLDAYRVLVSGVGRHLAPNGRLLLEIGQDQGRAVADLCGAAGLEGVQVHRDINGKDRVVGALMPIRNGG